MAKIMMMKQANLDRVRSNMRSQQLDYSSKLDDVLKKHHDIDNQVQNTRVTQTISTKQASEIRKFKEDSIQQAKRHLNMQHMNKIMHILSKEKLVMDKIKKIDSVADTFQKTRNDLQIKTLTFRYE